MKKVLSLFMALIMLLSITAGIDMSSLAATNNHTAAEAVQWAKSQIGKALDYDGAYGAQCVDLIYYYYVYLGQSSKGGSAYAYMTNSLPSGWKRIKINSSSAMKAGDIAVWKQNYGEWTGSYGHVSIVESDVSTSSSKFTTIQQNYNNQQYVTQNSNMPKGAVYCVIRPDFKVPVTNVTVTFNGNGGTVSKSSITLKKGSTIGNNIPTTTNNNGYSFNGWYTAKAGGTKYSGTTAINSNITLYAQWIQNSTPVQYGKIYRIINSNSGMAIQSNGSGSGAFVRQQPISNANQQLWRVVDEDGHGNYKLQCLYGGRVLDVNGGSTALGTQLIVYDNENTSNQFFSFVFRGQQNGKDLYSIHHKKTGRALDIKEASKNAGAQLQTYYFHGNAQQLFRIEEVTNRAVSFHDNLSENYLPTPKDVYDYSGGVTPRDCYQSRNSEYAVSTVDPQKNMLVLNQIKAGNATNSYVFVTNINGSYNYDIYNLNDSTMYLYFTAKSSVEGAKMFFRWGYDSTTNCKSVTLSKTEKTYVVELPRTWNSGSNIHPWIDTACTVEMGNIYLTTEKLLNISDLPELASMQTDAFNAQVKSYDVSQNSGNYGYLPEPSAQKNGYVFAGWYTQRVGGTKVTEDMPLGYNTKLYAHWEKAELTDIAISTMPQKTVYEIGESLITSGLKLKLTYSDGSTDTITSGYTVSGFDSSTAGTKTVTVKYGNLSTKFTVTVNATEVDGSRVSVESKKASAGSTVLITVCLEENPGIWGMDLVVNYDKTQLTLTNVINGTVFSDSEWTPGNLSGNKYILSYEASGFDDVTANGILATLEFAVNENATADSFSSISLSYDAGDVINVNFDEIDLSIVPGGIHVTDFIYGDLNNDGLVNKKDSLLMKMYLADDTTVIDMQAADVYADGSINKKDSLYLKQYLAGLDVELGV